MLKIGEIRELVRLLDETSIAELALETEDMKFRIKKADVVLPAGTVYAPQGGAYMPAAQPDPATQQPINPSANTPAAEDAAATSSLNDALHIITSPMVGTFYRAPAPDSPSYVELGSKVNEKSVVCIIEAMKLMNEIESEISGEVVEILAENGQLVEYSQPLFRIRRS